MKKFLLCSCLIFVSFACLAKDYGIKEVKHCSSQMCDLEGNPITGTIKYYNDFTEVLVLETSYVDGKKEGVERQYNANGRLWVETPYVNGKMEGAQKWYNYMGNLEKEIPYVKGKKDGVEKHYDNKGNLTEEITYKKGKKKDNVPQKKDDNESLGDGIKVEETKPARNYFLPEEVVECPAGLCEMSGRELAGTVKTYFKDVLVYETPYVNGKKEGIEKHYDEQGKLKTETSYLKGKKDGVEKVYDEDGRLKTETSFVKNEKQGITKEYDEKGILLREIPYLKGKKDGIERYYDEKGILRKEEPYVDGKLQGVVRKYYSDGTLKSETPFEDNKGGPTTEYPRSSGYDQ